jgi:uncharacterized protein involved in type VI secretion and phage assembly
MPDTVAMALVENVEDPEGRGRVQVSYPWLGPTRENPWAPVASPMSGSERGMFFMPEVGDEALVAFEHGDFDHPVVVGFMWNGEARSPEQDYNNRVILTPGGHTLRFEDSDGERKIILRTDGGHELTLDDTPESQGITMKTSGSLEIKLSDVEQSIELKGGGRSLTMQGGTLQIR